MERKDQAARLKYAFEFAYEKVSVEKLLDAEGVNFFNRLISPDWEFLYHTSRAKCGPLHFANNQTFARPQIQESLSVVNIQGKQFHM